MPWSERLRPGDMGPGDLLPTEADDLRLEPGWTRPRTSPPPTRVGNDGGTTGGRRSGRGRGHHAGPRAARRELAEELGMRRARVLSRYGLHTGGRPLGGVVRPQDPDGPGRAGLLRELRLPRPDRGSLRQAFGICANEFGPADGRVVSLAYGCGGHSEAAVMPVPQRPSPPVLDELGAEPLR